jgi:hypothetical protein
MPLEGVIAKSEADWNKGTNENFRLFHRGTAASITNRAKTKLGNAFGTENNA